MKHRLVKVDAFSFFNGKQYDFSFFFTTFVFRTKNNANQKGIAIKT